MTGLPDPGWGISLWLGGYHPYLGWWSCLCPHATFHGGWTCWTHPLQIMIAAWKPAETTPFFCDAKSRLRVASCCGWVKWVVHCTSSWRRDKYARPAEMPSVCRSQVFHHESHSCHSSDSRKNGQGGRPLFEKQLIHTVAARSLATQVPDACSGVWGLIGNLETSCTCGFQVMTIPKEINGIKRTLGRGFEGV